MIERQFIHFTKDHYGRSSCWDNVGIMCPQYPSRRPVIFQARPRGTTEPTRKPQRAATDPFYPPLGSQERQKLRMPYFTVLQVAIRVRYEAAKEGLLQSNLSLSLSLPHLSIFSCRRGQQKHQHHRYFSRRIGRHIDREEQCFTHSYSTKAHQYASIPATRGSILGRAPCRVTAPSCLCKQIHVTRWDVPSRYSRIGRVVRLGSEVI